jgi:signal transduction histidine kinase
VSDLTASLDGSSAIPGAGTTARGFWQRRGRGAALYAAGSVFVALLSFGIVVTSDLAGRSRQPAQLAFLLEMTGVLSLALLAVPLMAFFRRFPFRRGHLLRRLALYLPVLLAFAVTHTLLMWGSRTLLFRILGWGHFDYGDMRFRFLMEGQKQMTAFAILYAGVAIVEYTRRNRRREWEAATLERQLTEARLAALKMQLNPHFLFNTLNMISSHVHERPDVAEAMLERLSDFLRLTLRRSTVQEVPLGEELAFLDAYLDIMKARFEERLAVEIDVDPEARKVLVPHLILQPLVENAVTHCMAEPGKQGRIRVAAGRAGHRLRLTVEDNGPGLDPARGTTGEAPERGVGLTNTAARLQHLYGEEQRLELVNRPGGGLRLELEVPWRTLPEAAS